MPPQPVPADFAGKIWYYFHPENELVYLGMLAIALIISVIFNRKRTVKDIWDDMWPKLVFFAAVYIVIMIVVWATNEAP